MRALVQEVPLDPRLRDHALKGEFAGRRECHVEPDWLLVYKLEPALLSSSGRERTLTFSSNQFPRITRRDPCKRWLWKKIPVPGNSTMLSRLLFNLLS